MQAYKARYEWEVQEEVTTVLDADGNLDLVELAAMFTLHGRLSVSCRKLENGEELTNRS